MEKKIGPMRLFRKINHLRQQDIADKLEVSRSAVMAWEAGRAVPHPKHLAKLAELLGVPPETLFEPKGGKKGPGTAKDAAGNGIDR